jgi:hypothetical protein
MATSGRDAGQKPGRRPADRHWRLRSPDASAACFLTVPVRNVAPSSSEMLRRLNLGVADATAPDYTL